MTHETAKLGCRVEDTRKQRGEPGLERCGSLREDGIVDWSRTGLRRLFNEKAEEALTVISAYGCSGKAARRVCSSSGAMRATAS
jgi:hypothetical protein